MQEATQADRGAARAWSAAISIGCPGWGASTGCAVWSPTHFPRPVALSLPASRLPGRLPRRRAQIIQMGEITFANVHLSHGQLLNRRQLARIAAALRGKPSAIIGDYNAVGPVILPGFPDVGPREPTHHVGQRHAGPARPLPGAQAHLQHAVAALDFGPSDHRPIRLELRVADSTQAAAAPPHGPHGPVAPLLQDRAAAAAPRCCAGGSAVGRRRCRPASGVASAWSPRRSGARSPRHAARHSARNSAGSCGYPSWHCR